MFHRFHSHPQQLTSQDVNGIASTAQKNLFVVGCHGVVLVCLLVFSLVRLSFFGLTVFSFVRERVELDLRGWNWLVQIKISYGTRNIMRRVLFCEP